MHILSRAVAFLLLIISSPLSLLISVCIKLDTQGPIIFTQKRLGKDKKAFTIYKFRTMIMDAESLQFRYKELNEASGPTFKIRHDPRHTKVGKFLAKNAFDEIPQLVNILKGNMAFVGPRPLPVLEAMKISNKYKGRFSVLPGLTSPWVIKGSHKLSFDEWMRLDCDYASSKNAWGDMIIVLKTIIMLLRNAFVN